MDRFDCIYSFIFQVIYYSTEIFEGAGLSKENSQYATVGVGGVNVAMTFVSALIMDRAGRRTLHLIGLGGMFVGSLVLTIGLEYQVSKITLPCQQYWSDCEQIRESNFNSDWFRS